MQSKKYLSWYFSLPTIQRSVGILDSYGNGKVHCIYFDNECTVVWIGYKTKSKAFSYK